MRQPQGFFGDADDVASIGWVSLVVGIVTVVVGGGEVTSAVVVGAVVGVGALVEVVVGLVVGRTVLVDGGLVDDRVDGGVVAAAVGAPVVGVPVVVAADVLSLGARVSGLVRLDSV